MKSELAQKLREILDNKTQEQINQEWAAVKALNLDGPTMEEVVMFFSAFQFQLGQYNLNSELISENAANNVNYALAA
ncbi:MAG: hypothetical protein ACYC2P_06370 [Paludibacteraceae bacterium]